ncbi:MAG: 3-oxoacid CoA-transferase subunit B [Lachnospiraceae bacterium]|nr:3-oxoacid CoA-transferase subunit B [Lachnospiraceae bacterium]MBQ1400238.1 3-oxoacid CoA-transferase subunit B [Lachnospiraceae bacterium]MBQ1415575.1 3-oxoacid CoA-transferase subunit B [Lachnospiraceae bacterium]MBQ3400878.1 3-oxoacid CoA-transferase subunit B [Lachnospiraceae bacterium]MBQ4309367.1 3-oxoacid CoA-transferase subunit B [Lachnospiraceae bacterium]
MADLKMRIAKRAAKEIHNGDVVNLGIGLPTMIPKFVPEDIHVTIHSENGFAGLGAAVEHEAHIDTDIIDSSGSYVTTAPHVKHFDSADSFGIIRGGHVDATILGAMEVAENGDIANWIIPGGKVAGMGGAMDLVVGAKKVIVAMIHTQKGKPKIVERCALPLTAEKCVNMIITEMGVMEIRPEGVVVTELHPDYTKEDIQNATACKLIFAPDLKVMEEE